MPDKLDIATFASQYAVPWTINILLALAIFVVGRWLIGPLVRLLRAALEKAGMEAILINFVANITRILLLLFIIIAALNQLGVDTTSLIALVGAAGLAVGLALQNSLQNFAAGVLLILFRPFRTGDYVEAGGTSGVVESIGIFTTTLRTGDNREVIVPNGKIYDDTITNYSARETRRIDMVFGIGYEDDIRKAKEILERLLREDERVLKEPPPLVAVAELGESSVNFNVRPWVKSSDYWGVRYDLTERVKLAFDEAGISIPYPQLDVHLQGDSP